METKKAAIKGDKSKRWQGLLIEYENRVDSSSEFCKRNKISRSNLYKWRKYFSNEAIAIIKVQSQYESSAAKTESRDAISYISKEKKAGFIPLAVECEARNKLEKVASKYGKKISDEQKQVSKINSPIKISKNSGIKIEFMSGCTIDELEKIIEVINAAQ